MQGYGIEKTRHDRLRVVSLSMTFCLIKVPLQQMKDLSSCSLRAGITKNEGHKGCLFVSDISTKKVESCVNMEILQKIIKIYSD